jgi:DNA-binding NarL/FixJ family response regulator
MAITVLIADDHDIIREGIKNIIKKQSVYEVVGEAADGEETLLKAEKLKPDILLLDISMPKISGLDIIGQIHRLSAKTKILIISVHKASAYIMKALKSGVMGYLNKENAAEDLLPALRKVVDGKVFLSSSVSSYLADKIQDKGPEEALKKELLTEREQEVLRLVVEGKTAKEIAKTLYISHRTVENYKNSILEKLGLEKTSDLIKYAIKHKIVDVDEY